MSRLLISQGDVDEAHHELMLKSKQDIEIETAIKWGSRAIAAYETFDQTNDPATLSDAIEYHHEAIEHAAETPILMELREFLDNRRSQSMLNVM